MARGIEQQSPPGEIFRSMVENAVQLCEGDNVQGNVVNELCSDEGLANVCFCSHVTILCARC